MKKVIKIAFVMIMCMATIGCANSPKLTSAQKECCKEVDGHLENFAEEFNVKFTKEIKEKEGKILYIAKLNATDNSTANFNDSNASSFDQYLRPAMEDILHEENLYFALYLCNDGEEVYRITDSMLNPEILD